MEMTADTQNTREPEKGRRSFLTKLWIGLGILALMEYAGILFGYLRRGKPRITPGDFGTVIEAGTIDEFELHSVTAFRKGHFYLSRLEDGGFLALSRRCTHLGCTVPWIPEEKRFACPCHGSVFDIRGNVLNPPAPRALDLFPVVIENKRIKVDTGRPIKRSEFRAAQVAYPPETNEIS